MKIIDKKIKIIKKEKYVFLLIIASFVIAFSAVNDSFAVPDVRQAVIDDITNVPKQAFKKIQDFSINETEEIIKTKKCGISSLNYADTPYITFTRKQAEKWERQVKHDIDLGQWQNLDC